MRRLLRCVARGHPGTWEAICLDLDIAVQGQSFEEVYRSLDEAVEAYIETVSELAEREQRSLLHRPVPISVRMRYLIGLLVGAWKNRSENDTTHQYTILASA